MNINIPLFMPQIAQTYDECIIATARFCNKKPFGLGEL